MIQYPSNPLLFVNIFRMTLMHMAVREKKYSCYSNLRLAIELPINFNLFIGTLYGRLFAFIHLTRPKIIDLAFNYRRYSTAISDNGNFLFAARSFQKHQSECTPLCCGASWHFNGLQKIILQLSMRLHFTSQFICGGSVTFKIQLHHSNFSLDIKSTVQ